MKKLDILHIYMKNRLNGCTTYDQEANAMKYQRYVIIKIVNIKHIRCCPLAFIKLLLTLNL